MALRFVCNYNLFYLMVQVQRITSQLTGSHSFTFMCEFTLFAIKQKTKQI